MSVFSISGAGIIAAVPDDDNLRATLLAYWHLVATEVTRLPGGVRSRAWEVTVSDERYVARLTTCPARGAIEAGLMAAEYLRVRGVAAGEPVRTLGGALTAESPGGTLAVLRRVAGRTLSGADPIDQQWWGDRLGAVHRALQGFAHPGLRKWNALNPAASHLSIEPWLRNAVIGAVTAATRLTVTDRLTYGVLHGDPAPEDFVIDVATGRAGVLDCGSSSTGPLVLDVAAAVVYAGGPEASAELLDGYLSAGLVRRDELDAALPVLLRFRWAEQADWSARQLTTCPQPACRAGAGEMLRRARTALDSLPG